MAIHHHRACLPTAGSIARRATLLKRACSRQCLSEDTRRAAYGNQPGRLFFHPLAGINPNGGASWTISTRHEAWLPTEVLVSAGSDPLTFRVVPCAFTCVKTRREICSTYHDTRRLQHGDPAQLKSRKEARYA